MTNYLRRYIRGYASRSHNLRKLTRKGKFQWNNKAEAAFEDLKKAISEAPTLAFVDYSLPFVVVTDASYTGLGGYVAQ